MTPRSRAVLEVVSEVQSRAKTDRLSSLFLDFDGTLVPIAANPSVPRLDRTMRELLERIVAGGCCVVAIISGRAIDDLIDRVGLPNIIYAGNHGLEIRGPGINFVEPEAAAWVERLRTLSRDLAVTLRPLKGALVEYKGLTTSVHYRQVGPADVALVEQAVRAAIPRDDERFDVNDGKMVLEIVPRTNWHKGAAAQWIIERLDLDEKLAIFIGDDRTDEKGFAALTQAITVKVGCGGGSMATHNFPDCGAVREFLEWVADGRS